MATIPEIISRWVDNDGAPLPFSKLYSYAAHSSVPKQLFSDVDCTIPLSNPLISDASGKFGQFFATSGRYKFALHSQTDDLIDTRDDIEASGNGSVGTVTSVQVTLGAALGAAQHVTTPPVTSAGNINMEFLPQSSRYVLIGPAGSTGLPTFRALEVADIPDLSGRYLPLAGGTMDPEAVIHGSDSFGSIDIEGSTIRINTSSGSMSFVDGNTIQFADSDSNQSRMTSSIIQMQNYDATRECAIWANQFALKKVSGGAGSDCIEMIPDALNIRDATEQSSQIRLTRVAGGASFVMEAGTNWSTPLRSITADVTSGAMIEMYNSDYSAGTIIIMRGGAAGATTYRNASFGTTGLFASAISPVATSSVSLSSLDGHLETVQNDTSGGILRSGYYHSDYNSVRYNAQRLRNITSASGVEVESTANSGSATTADFLLSNYRTCFVGQDFDIRNGKSLKLAGVDRITTGGAGSFAGLTSSAGATFTGGKVTLAAAAAGYASLNIPTRSAMVTTPVTGDIQSDGFTLFLHGLGITCIKGAGDTIGTGSACVLTDATSPTKGWAPQLSTTNTLDFWNYSGSWAKKVQFSSAGGIGFFGIAAPTTRPTVNAECADLATAVALVNQLRTHLIACGMVQ